MTDAGREATRPTRLWLIRHAQASFGSANYDQLSARGEVQAERLAAWLTAHPDLEFARVVSGTLVRHGQTLAAIERAFAAAGRALPVAERDADWNEFAHDVVIGAYMAGNPNNPVVTAARDAPTRHSIHALLSAALEAWANAELDGAVPETWSDFGARIARARTRLDAMRGKILVVSSGGPITRCAQAALGCDASRTVALNLALRNTAVSEFRGGADGWRLHIWNMLPHLAHPSDREWITYY